MASSSPQGAGIVWFRSGELGSTIVKRLIAAVAIVLQHCLMEAIKPWSPVHNELVVGIFRVNTDKGAEQLFSPNLAEPFDSFSLTLWIERKPSHNK